MRWVILGDAAVSTSSGEMRVETMVAGAASPARYAFSGFSVWQPRFRSSSPTFRRHETTAVTPAPQHASRYGIITGSLSREALAF